MPYEHLFGVENVRTVNWLHKRPVFEMADQDSTIDLKKTIQTRGPSAQIPDLIIPKIATGVGGSEALRSFPW